MVKERCVVERREVDVICRRVVREDGYLYPIDHVEPSPLCPRVSGYLRIFTGSLDCVMLLIIDHITHIQEFCMIVFCIFSDFCIFNFS